MGVNAVQQAGKVPLTEVFDVLDVVAATYPAVAVGFSGGKDSTASLVLIEEWLQQRSPVDAEFFVVHNDTLAEITIVESWAREFLSAYTRRVEKLGARVHTIITTPPATQTFYWRLIVRGYPMPTFKWRWCVKLLKIKPTFKALESLVDEHGRVALLVGSRREESAARSLAMVRRGAVSPNVIFVNKLLRTGFSGVDKYAPIEDWSLQDVWAYLGRRLEDWPILRKLFTLYQRVPENPCAACSIVNGMGVRYGCWLCTVARIQRGNVAVGETIDPGYKHVEVVRRLLRAISDTPELRLRKNWGYTRMGGLNLCGRSLALASLRVGEKLSNTRFYGLDEARIHGYTLREIFYHLEPRIADRIIGEADKTQRAREIGMAILREPRTACDSEQISALRKHVREDYLLEEIMS